MQQSGFSLIDDSIRGDCEKRSSQQDISEESVFLSSVSEEQRRKELENSPEDIRQEILAYKKVANRVRPVATTLPEEFRIVRRFPSDPLADLPKLPTSPPDFIPGERFTWERMELICLQFFMARRSETGPPYYKATSVRFCMDRRREGQILRRIF